MNLNATDKREIEQYTQEAKAKWVQTDAYRTYEQRSKNGSIRQEAAAEMMVLFRELGALKHLSPADDAVQARIAALQALITENYYLCTNKILMGLGQMYTADERFRQNIDKAGGESNADFVSKAICIYCQMNQTGC